MHEELKSMTNTEFIKYLMNHSRHGAMMQMFIIDALSKHADAVAEADPKTFDSGWLNGQSWVNTAKECSELLKQKYGA